MGQPRAGRSATKSLLNAERLDLQSATMSLCQEYMESDEHERIFNNEAEGWFKDTFSKAKYATREAVMATWPDTGKAFGWVKTSLREELEDAIQDQPKTRRRLVDTELLDRVLVALRAIEERK